MRSDYYTCPRCGASLDPGEQCDCTKKALEQEIWCLLDRLDWEKLDTLAVMIRRWVYHKPAEQAEKKAPCKQEAEMR